MATKGVVCSYQEVIDLHTESDHVTCLGIHTPTGDTPRRMFKGFFDQYKKYRYLGCSMKLVPAARLPADPMHVNTEAGELIISPRDLMNPILFHGCHGDDLGTILNTLYGSEDVMDSLSALDTQVGSAGDNIKTGFYEILERLYYRALTDNTWKKASVSRGFRKDNLHPLVYSLATNRQIMPGSQGVEPLDIQQNDYLAARQRDPSLDIDPVAGETGVFNYSMKNNLTFMTPRLTSLGWMDTRNVLTSLPDNFGVNVNTLVEDLQRPLAEMVNYAELPKLFMGCVLLPPAYLQEQYFRLIINHRFAFKNFRGISFTPMVQAAPAYADANDDLFNPEKFTGADFDGGSSGGGDDPEPEPEPEPDPPTGYYYIAVDVINNFSSEKHIRFLTPQSDVITMWDFEESSTVPVDPATYTIAGNAGSRVLYLAVPNGGTVGSIQFSSNGTNWSAVGSSVVSPALPWDATKLPYPGSAGTVTLG